jgi:short-subunit dehydrogenase
MAQIILITGASKGIGLEIARSLHAKGHIVYGTSRAPNRDSRESFALLPLDVTQQDSVESCVATVIGRHGRIDVLINNAGYDLYGAAEEAGMDALHAQLDTNFFGAVRVTLAVLPQMRAQRSGKIINISSIGGLISLPYNSAYAASKYALEGYSESLRYELLPFGIYVSLVEPPSVNTDTIATSTVAVESSHPAYQAQRERLFQQMRDAAPDGVSTHQVAQAVMQVVKQKRPNLRYPIGLQTRFAPQMKQLLPQRLYESFILRQFSTSST